MGFLDRLKQVFRRPAATPPAKVLAANLWAVYNLGDPNERYQRFLERGRPRLKSLIESILIHDDIVIPTQDFLNLTVLVGVLGERPVIDLLEARCLKFIRVRGGLAYVGNGGGIKGFQFEQESSAPDSPLSTPVVDSIKWALSGLNPKPSDPILPRLVVEATQQVGIDDVSEQIRHETYMDVINSQDLRRTFALRNTNMDHLAGIQPNGVRIYGGIDTELPPDEINLVMALATANLEFRLAQITGCADSSTASPVGHLLKAKVRRTFPSLDAGQHFDILRKIAGMPDIGEAVLTKQITIQRLLKLRHSRNGSQFRVWFHEKCRTDTATISREYIALLRSVPIVGLVPVRIMRFLTTTTLGLIPGVGLAVGAAAGAIDSFCLDGWLRGTSPKFFIEDLAQLGEHGRAPEMIVKNS